MKKTHRYFSNDTKTSPLSMDCNIALSITQLYEISLIYKRTVESGRTSLHPESGKSLSCLICLGLLLALSRRKPEKCINLTREMSQSHSRSFILDRCRERPILDFFINQKQCRLKVDETLSEWNKSIFVIFQAILNKNPFISLE